MHNFAFVPKAFSHFVHETDFLIKQWMEKKPNGVFIFRNDRAEDREARKHSTSKHKSMDLLISKIQTHFEKEMEGRVSLFLLSFLDIKLYQRLVSKGF